MRDLFNKEAQQESMERTIARAKDEEARGWLGGHLTNSIPALEIPEGLKIKIIPPFCFVDARFRLMDSDGNTLSVYLDLHENAGLFGGPYWEIYGCDMDDVERFEMSEEGAAKMMARIRELFNV